eukprot:485105_1
MESGNRCLSTLSYHNCRTTVLTAVTVALVRGNARHAWVSDKQRARIQAEEKLHRTRRRRNFVDKQFFRTLASFMSIAVPGWRSPEAGYLMIFTAFLVARTFLS